jgi:hypothetical protein
MKNILASFIIMVSMLTGNSQMAFADTSEVLVNGETPEIYFKRFFYQTSGACHDQYGVWFHFVESMDDSFKLPDSADGRERKAELAVYIEENGEYAADLSEEIFYEKRGDIVTYRQISKERIMGKWNITVDGKLRLEGLGVASALQYNGNPAMEFKAESAIMNGDLLNQSVILIKVVGTSGRDPYNQICGF